MSVALRAIAHSYDGERWVLGGIDLDVSTGEAIAVVGPSGSGKSTLLAIVGGLLTPTRGEISYASTRSPSDARPVTQPRIVWVFQTTNVLAPRTVLDNVAIGPLAVGYARPEAEATAREALEAVGLGNLAGRRSYTLSGGERQRVCIARAMAAQPDLILADEPTGNLDQQTSRHVTELLLRTRSQGVALLIATHDSSVAALCNRVVRLQDGLVTDQR